MSKDLYIHSSKIGSKTARNFSKNPKAADNNSSGSLKKIQLLPISKRSKQTLTNLVISHAIYDITKLDKISKKSVTIHGKVNIKNTGCTEDVIIKVYNEVRKINDKLYAYSRNIYKEEKPSLPDIYPVTINSDPDYLKEHIVYYKDDNIVIIKMFKGCKTIEQMIKSFPNKKKQFLVELFLLYSDLKRVDCYLWGNCACTVKNILWHNGKWIFLSTNCEADYYNYRKGMETDNVLEIIELFRTHGMSNEEILNVVREQKILHCSFPSDFYTRMFLEKHFAVEK